MRFTADMEYYDQFGKLHLSRIAENSGDWVFQEENVFSRELGIGISFHMTECSISVPLEKCVEQGRCRVRSLTLLPELVSCRENEGKTLVIPYGSGALVRPEGKYTQETVIGGFFPWGAVGLMSFYAVTDGKKSLLATVDGGKYDMLFRLRTAWGKEKISSVAGTFIVRDHVSDDPSRETLGIAFHRLSGGLPEIARTYRDDICAKNAIPLLSERAEKEPLIEYSSRAIVMRMRLACKEMPSPITEQTKDHQPELNIYMTFDDALAVLQECRRQEVGPLDCCLVGWNNGGHDGSYPQIFPVEERLGGEAKLRSCIQGAKENGYRIGLHDNYFDSYTIANNFSWEKVERTHEQLPALSGIWGGGQSYIVCPKCSLSNAEKNMAQAHELGINGLYFTDVISVWPLEKCYSKIHPLTRRECAFWRKKILRLAHDTFGGIMSEGGQDWAFPELDRVYDMIDTPSLPAWCDCEYPLYQMVYHGRCLYNTYRGGINSWPGEDIYLRNLSFGGLPTVYWHYIFHPAQTVEGGQDPKKDLRFSPETLAQEVARIKRVTDDVARLEKTRFALMISYEKISETMTETGYDNGIAVIVNYGTSPAVFRGITIPAKDFLVYKERCTEYKDCTINHKNKQERGKEP